LLNDHGNIKIDTGSWTEVQRVQRVVILILDSGFWILDKIKTDP
jgi:hypothetical protein